MVAQLKKDHAEQSSSWWPVTGLPHWRTFDELFRDTQGRRLMAIDEFTEGDFFVVRAEIPGIDPDKDVEVMVKDGMLEIRAERTEKAEKEGRHFHRSELRYGSFARTIALPDGVDDTAVEASYKDGILEVRVPVPEKHEVAEEAARKILVSHS